MGRALVGGACEHRQLTSAGRLRAPSFQGFREEKTPDECTFSQLVDDGSGAAS